MKRVNRMTLLDDALDDSFLAEVAALEARLREAAAAHEDKEATLLRAFEEARDCPSTTPRSPFCLASTRPQGREESSPQGRGCMGQRPLLS